MENFWNEISGKLKDAFDKAEDKSKKDINLIKNIPAMLSFLGELEGDELLLWLDQARKIKKRREPKFPPINGDFYDTRSHLTDEERVVLANVRRFMLEEVEPIATEY